MNSGKFNSLDREESSKAIIEELQAIDESNKFATEYKMRDWLVSRQRYWGAPIPAIHCDSCGWLTDPNLPIKLPEIG